MRQINSNIGATQSPSLPNRQGRTFRLCARPPLSRSSAWFPTESVSAIPRVRRSVRPESELDRGAVVVS
ncbi:hypothetical protein C5E45_14860 [Nocardia nova]|uniref:Uncharacterized protein n=1 Tax=Nocardia nova TaxID=37330 RepID=A0A2S6AQE3_9NOCA|nr:hypothetical protein C5E41_17550 [Nocardia nova]PPJ37406.1 hypothetical protein C5E45_14860 [Nocardia nova]